MTLRTPRIAVVGDIILDKYSYGSVNRISPEAPIQILAVERETYKPGGAGNAAANLATLGAAVDLFGVVGDDAGRALLLDAVKPFGVRCGIVTDSKRHTIVKQRLISASQQLLRVDYENIQELERDHVDALARSFDPPYDAVIISDYAKGVVCPLLMDFLRSRSIPLFVDPKPANLQLYHGVKLVKPNVKECLEMTGETDDVLAAQALSRRLQTTVLLTRGRKGMAYVEDGDTPALLLQTEAKEVVDVTGAGDTVIATYVYFHCLGYEPRDAVAIANAAAGIAVSRVGCYQVTLEDLKGYLSSSGHPSRSS